MGWFEDLIARQQPGSVSSNLFGGGGTATETAPPLSPPGGVAPVLDFPTPDSPVSQGDYNTPQPAISLDRWWSDPNVVSTASTPNYNILGGVGNGTGFWLDAGWNDGNPQLGAPAPGTGPQQVDPVVPEWATIQGYEDPQQFYDWYQGLHPDMRGAAEATGNSLIDARAKSEARREAALAYGTEQYDRITGAYDAWKKNPNRETVLAELSRRSGEDFDLVTEREQGATLNRLAQAAATSRGNAQSMAAGRGMGGSGTDFQNQSAIDAISAAGGLQYEGRVDAVNAQARQNAINSLGTFEDSGARIDQAYLGLLDQVAGRNAAIEDRASDIPAVDVMAFEQLNFARGAYDTEIARLGAAQEAFAKESQFNLWDVGDFILRGLTAFPGLLD